VISDGAPTGTVTTVLGNIDARSLGRTNYHEHLFQVTPLLPGDEEASRQEAALLRESGFDAMIDATPTGLGRNPVALARISRATGIHVVATTGGHREAHYAPGHWLLEPVRVSSRTASPTTFRSACPYAMTLARLRWWPMRPAYLSGLGC
jgi:predicted metal-dependent phosphotriesterase family hydrolase